MVGEPPSWLATLVLERLGSDSDLRVALLHSLLVTARTDRMDWTELRRAGLDLCRRPPLLTEDVMEFGENKESLRGVKVLDRSWPADQGEDKPVTLCRCDLRVVLRSGEVTNSIGYATDRYGARNSAVFRFLARTSHLDASSVAPHDLAAEYLCLIEDRPDLVRGLSDSSVRIVAVHLDDVEAPPESLLNELSRRVAGDGVSPGVAAMMLAAVPGDIGRASPAWHRLVGTVEKAAADRPGFALGLFNEGLRCAAWSMWLEAGRATVCHRRQVIASNDGAERTDAWAQAMIVTICANLVRGMQLPQVGRPGIG